jgi:hypothetical protein
MRIQNSKGKFFWSFGIEIWNLFRIWKLGFVILDFRDYTPCALLFAKINYLYRSRYLSRRFIPSSIFSKELA